MAKRLNAIFNVIDAISEKTSKIVSLLIFVVMVITTVEVVGRYVFNHPTSWAWPINRQLFGVFILFAGIYAMSKEDHIKVEILYDHFSPKMKKNRKVDCHGNLSLFHGRVGLARIQNGLEFTDCQREAYWSVPHSSLSP